MYSLSGYISPQWAEACHPLWNNIVHWPIACFFFPFPLLPPLPVLLFLLFHHFALSSVSSTVISIFGQMKWLEDEGLQRDGKRRLTCFLTTPQREYFLLGFVLCQCLSDSLRVCFHIPAHCSVPNSVYSDVKGG